VQIPKLRKGSYFPEFLEPRRASEKAMTAVIQEAYIHPKPLRLVVDSTGLKIFGEGEWLEEKHKNKRNRRSWRKLHLGLNLVSGEIVCSALTRDDVSDPTALPDLLDQVDGPADLFLADGAYDGEPTSDLLAARFGSTIEVTIPPPRNAILSPNAAQNMTARDCHIADITARGLMASPKASGYNQRSRIES
jgi:hypothetical protein